MISLLPNGEYIIRFVKTKKNAITLEVLEGSHDGCHFSADVPPHTMVKPDLCCMAKIVKRTGSDGTEFNQVKRIFPLGYAPAALEKCFSDN